MPMYNKKYMHLVDGLMHFLFFYLFFLLFLA